MLWGGGEVVGGGTQAPGKEPTAVLGMAEWSTGMAGMDLAGPELCRGIARGRYWLSPGPSGICQGLPRPKQALLGYGLGGPWILYPDVWMGGAEGGCQHAVSSPSCGLYLERRRKTTTAIMCPVCTVPASPAARAVGGRGKANRPSEFTGILLSKHHRQA